MGGVRGVLNNQIDNVKLEKRHQGEEIRVGDTVSQQMRDDVVEVGLL